MKTNKIIALAGAILALCACGKQELPYDLEGTEHGVVLNIRKVAGTSTTLATDLSGTYKVAISVAEQQGDMSMFKEAQLMAVYTDGTTKAKKGAKIVEGIVDLPATVTIDMNDVCTKLGVTTVSIGDRIEFTPCVTLKSGTQIDGWSALTGFNNVAFVSWQQADGPLTYRVAYTAFAPFQQAKFQGPAVAYTWEYKTYAGAGTCSVTQLDMTDPDNMPPAEYIPAGVTATDLVGLVLAGPFWFETADEAIKMWINTQDFTLIIPDQVMAPSYDYGGMGDDGKIGNAEDCEGEVDTLNNTLTFLFYPTFGPGYWWGAAVVVVVTFV
ncbi:MAG: hypothetical protein K6F58_04295 [Bacteroidales bacterium]|nr:hypothetical protein [Bacteroidales bacterium]